MWKRARIRVEITYIWILAHLHDLGSRNWYETVNEDLIPDFVGSGIGSLPWWWECAVYFCERGV